MCWPLLPWCKRNKRSRLHSLLLKTNSVLRSVTRTARRVFFSFVLTQKKQKVKASILGGPIPFRILKEKNSPSGRKQLFFLRILQWLEPRLRIWGRSGWRNRNLKTNYFSCSFLLPWCKRSRLPILLLKTTSVLRFVTRTARRSSSTCLFFFVLTQKRNKKSQDCIVYS